MSRTSKGLTLLELLISVSLISIMLGAVWIIYHTGYDVFYSQYSRQNIKSQASLAFITMTNELHQALSVTAATATSLTFTMDQNNDGAYETVRYSWSGVVGDPLNRISGSDTRQLIRSVTSLSFGYYGANNAHLGPPIIPSQVMLVAIDCTVASGAESFHLRTKVDLRCI